MAFITFYVIKLTIGLRASDEEQLRGLDASEHDVSGYPDFAPAPVVAPLVAPSGASEEIDEALLPLTPDEKTDKKTEMTLRVGWTSLCTPLRQRAPTGPLPISNDGLLATSRSELDRLVGG